MTELTQHARDLRDIAGDFQLAASSLNQLLYRLEKVNAASEEPVELETMKVLYACRDEALKSFSLLHEVVFKLEVKKGVY